MCLPLAGEGPLFIKVSRVLGTHFRLTLPLRSLVACVVPLALRCAIRTCLRLVLSNVPTTVVTRLVAPLVLQIILLVFRCILCERLSRVKFKLVAGVARTCARVLVGAIDLLVILSSSRLRLCPLTHAFPDGVKLSI